MWRLLDGDVALLKYANDVHGSGDVANAALIGGRLVALVRIRVLDEVRWVYGWSQDMWREIAAGDGPAHPETQPSIAPGEVAAPARNALLQKQAEPEEPALQQVEQLSSEKLLTTGRGGGKLRVGKPADLLITRPHAAANPFTHRLACTSAICSAGTCNECRETACDGYAQLIGEAADELGVEASISAIGDARQLAVHAEYADRDASAPRQALSECAEAVNLGLPVRLLCSCPLHLRCHRDVARAHSAAGARVALCAATAHRRWLALQMQAAAMGRQAQMRGMWAPVMCSVLRITLQVRA